VRIIEVYSTIGLCGQKAEEKEQCPGFYQMIIILWFSLKRSDVTALSGGRNALTPLRKCLAVLPSRTQVSHRGF